MAEQNVPQPNNENGEDDEELRAVLELSKNNK